MSAQQGLTYSVDIALCIDATGSMSPIIDRVKKHALSFYTEVTQAMDQKQKRINNLRVRVIIFRDYHVDGPAAMLMSPFFELPSDQDKLAAFMAPIKASGGGDEPESALEALALAMKSEWVRSGDRRRHVVVIWTDASAHRLEDAASRGTPGYPTGLPGTFADLTAMWEGQDMDQSAKRLLFYAPDAWPWNDIQSMWENSAHASSKAGQGLQEVEFAQVLEMIANSI